MPTWAPMKFDVEGKPGFFELLTKNQPDPVRIFGEKTNSSPTRKFVAHAVKGAANSNILINLSCRRDATYLRRLEWFPRRNLDIKGHL